MRSPCCAITSKPLSRLLVGLLRGPHPALPHKVFFFLTVPPWQLSDGILIA
jgi:hypothetical protein